MERDSANILDVKNNILHQTRNSRIIDAGKNVFKIYNPEYIINMLSKGISLEDKILESEILQHIDGIVFPNGIKYIDNQFSGFRMEKLNGTPYSRIPYDNIFLEDYAILYSKFEEILDKASEANIVITDFANGGNIILENSDDCNAKITDRKINIIDDDGMQIKNHKTNVITDSILCPLIYTDKYFRDGYYTTELNSLSLLYFYFADVLQFKLNMVENLVASGNISFRDIMEVLGIDDEIIIREILKSYYADVANPHFSRIFDRIAEKYDLIEAPLEQQDVIAVKLKKKSIFK